MPNITLKALEGRPDPKIHAVVENAAPLEPIHGQRGDDNWLCGHCDAIVVKGIRPRSNR